MLTTATRRLLQHTSGATAGRQWMARIAARIPATGISGSQLHAMLQDEFPTFSPVLVGAMTLKEAVQQHPDLLQVEESSHSTSKWYVRSVRANALPNDAPLSPSSSKTQAALQKIQQVCMRRASQGHNSYLTLENLMAQTELEDVGIVDELLRATHPGLDVQAGVRVKPKRIPRTIVAFVDGDALPAVAVNEMCNEMNVLKDSSSVLIVRQSGSHALTDIDTICPDVIPTYLCIEKHARELRLRRPDVRQDVVYMCVATQFQTYAEHVAPLNPFPDADVYVCCPSKIALVMPKKVISFV